jgi:hypothetical protein
MCSIFLLFVLVCRNDFASYGINVIVVFGVAAFKVHLKDKGHTVSVEVNVKLGHLILGEPCVLQGHSLGLVSTLAAASLAATHSRNIDFVHHLWESKHEPYDDGYFDAYYDGLLRLFAFMHLSGNYRVILPAE